MSAVKQQPALAVGDREEVSAPTAELEGAFNYYPNLQRVRTYVLNNLAASITLADAASVAGLERRYFSCYFRERVGIGFRDWLTLLRVSRAMEMIRRNDCPLALISDQVGFGDRRSFQRAFKKWVGTTAREYKTQMQRRLRGGVVTLVSR